MVVFPRCIVLTCSAGTVSPYYSWTPGSIHSWGSKIVFIHTLYLYKYRIPQYKIQQDKILQDIRQFTMFYCTHNIIYTQHNIIIYIYKYTQYYILANTWSIMFIFSIQLCWQIDTTFFGSLLNFLYCGILVTFHIGGFCHVRFCPVGFSPGLLVVGFLKTKSHLPSILYHCLDLVYNYSRCPHCAEGGVRFTVAPYCFSDKVLKW